MLKRLRVFLSRTPVAGPAGAPLLDNRIVGALFVLTALVADIVLTWRGSTAPALVMSVCTAGLGMLVGPVRPLVESRAIGAGLVLVCFGGDVWLTLAGKTVPAIFFSVGLALLAFVTASVWPSSTPTPTPTSSGPLSSDPPPPDSPDAA